MGKRQQRQGWMVLFLGLVLCGLSGRVAWAHVALLAAVPEPGATLTASPPQVQLTFDGDVATAPSQIMLMDKAFQSVPEVVMQPATAQSNRLVAQIPPLDPGRYTVQWTVVSIDGHPLSGSYTFSLAEQAESSILSVPLLIVLLLVILTGVVLLVTGRIRSRNAQ